MKNQCQKMSKFKTAGVTLLILLAAAFDQFAVSAQGRDPNTGQFRGSTSILGKMELDIRDYGVDCTFSNDSSPALNSLTADANANGRAITFPPGCHVKLAKTWHIRNLSGFTIRGTSGAGNNGSFATNVPTITWSGPQGGTMIDMQFVDGFVVENLAIDGGGQAAVGFNVDRYGPGGRVNTTDGIFRRLNVSANVYGGGNAGWVGMQFSMLQLNNVEDMRITDSVFYCGTTPTSGTAAIVIGPSYNPKNFKIQNNFIHQCNRAVWQRGGSALIASNEFGTNHIDVQLDFWTDPNERIIDNLSESAESGSRFLLVNGAVDHSVEISGNNIPVNDTCAVTLNSGMFFSGNSNTFYTGYGSGTGGHKLCDLGQHGPTWLAGPGWVHNLGAQDFAYFEAASISNNSTHSSVDAFGTTNVNQALLLGTGTRFLAREIFYNPGDAAFGMANAKSGGAIGSTPCSLNTVCLNEGATEIAGVASPDGLTCSVVGKSGDQTHHWYISAVDSAGNETFPRMNPGHSDCHKALASFDRDNYESLTWVPSPNAESYRLYLASPIAPNSQIALVAAGIKDTSYKFDGPLPSNFPVRADNNVYNKTLVESFRGKEFDFQYGTPLKGFRDRSTPTWSIDSRTGSGTFSKITGITDTTVVKNLNANYLEGKKVTDFAPADGTVDGKEIKPKSVVVQMLQLSAGPTPPCDANHRGQLNYAAGGVGVKDTVKICAKNADDSYSWSVIF